MPLHSSQYGDGLRQPENSALSGKSLDFGAGDVSFTINGYRIGVKAKEWRAASPEQKAAAKAEWAANLPAVKPTGLLAVEPPYDAMTLAELKQTAKDKGVDVSGRGSKDSLIQALRFADLQASATPSASNEQVLDPSEMKGE